VDYEPGETATGLFWRQFQLAWADLVSCELSAGRIATKVPSLFRGGFHCRVPYRSGKMLTLWEVAGELSRRMTNIFLQTKKGAGQSTAISRSFRTIPTGATSCSSMNTLMGTRARASVANHHTGWTGLVTKVDAAKWRVPAAKKHKRWLRKLLQTELRKVVSHRETLSELPAAFFMIQFQQPILGDLDAALRREWLETTGWAGLLPRPSSD